MKKLFETDPNNWSALVARLALGIVIFPHGAQKLLGWFGGYGFEKTMGFLTSQAKLPYIIALLVILIESVAALFVLVGFATRIAALAILVNFIGIVIKVHANNGFFMNWAGTQPGEGLEYFILLFGLTIILLITGGGKGSMDVALATRKRLNISLNPLGK
jgi:putative oxidoreductase